MLNLINVENISITDIKTTNFDIGIFASGYESRCSYLAGEIVLDEIKHKIILGFDEHRDNEIRNHNDKFYSSKKCEITIVSSHEERIIYGQLIKIFSLLRDSLEINILLDYTSMARIWYSGILNFIRLQENRKINVYLNYSLGDYNSNLLDYSYSSINSIPFHEGTLSSNTKTLLVLAVGFSPYLIKSVIEEIEPNHIIGILPIPNLEMKYEEISISIKNDILTKDIDEWIRCPINNLESIFSTYADITNNSLNKRDIIFLSLGPKIFTIASILVSQRFHQVTCLYLKSSNKTQLDVPPTGDFICNRITYFNE